MNRSIIIAECRIIVSGTDTHLFAEEIQSLEFIGYDNVIS